MTNFINNPIRRSLRPLVVSLFPGQQKLLDQLKAKRIAISNELTDIVNEFGPKLYEDFDEVYTTISSWLPYSDDLIHSGAFWFRLLVRLPREVRKVCGDGKALPEPSMRRVGA